MWLTFYLSVPSNKTVLFKIFENTNYVTLVAKSVSEIIYNKNVPDVSVAITDLLQGEVKEKKLCKSTKYSLGNNTPSSRLSGSLAQLISQASRIFLWCQLLLVLRIVASSLAIS